MTAEQARAFRFDRQEVPTLRRISSIMNEDFDALPVERTGKVYEFRSRHQQLFVWIDEKNVARVFSFAEELQLTVRETT